MRKSSGDQMRRASCIVIFLCLLIAGAERALAQTEVKGAIRGNTTWTVSRSPYIVVGDVRVEKGTTLTIQPGVHVKFDGPFSLTISGTLVARGTASNNVHFTSNRSAPNPGDWAGIRFEGTSEDAVLRDAEGYESGSVIEYARIEYGSGIVCRGDYLARDRTSPLIRRCTIANNSTDGRAGAPWLSGGGIACIYSDPIIVENTLFGNRAREDGGGIYCDRFAHPEIRGNRIVGNVAGVLGGGIYVDHSSAVISENTIIENVARKGGGICVLSGTGDYLPSIAGNALHSNLEYDLCYLGARDLNAYGNTWGTTDPDTLRAHICDGYDDAEFGGVVTGYEGTPAVAQVSASEYVLQAIRADASLKIDGRLDEPAWQTAEPAQGFVQREPTDGAVCSEPTSVRVLYDDEQVYFGFDCRDSEPHRIVANELRRDRELDGNDSVEILIDTYNDKRGGFFFRVNPLGAREDARVTGGSTNRNWDCIWEARSHIHDEGWTAEVAIPFSQLRFREADEMTWGINFGRNIRRTNEEAHWTPIPRAFGWRGRYRTSDIGRLVGLSGIRAPAHFEVKPYLLPGRTEDYSEDVAERETVAEFGLDLKYGITSNLTANLTYNTDFAQVEADMERVNLTRFSLFFPEKRPFFLEGAGVFTFGSPGGGFRPPPLLLFYTRRIGLEEGENIPIIGGAKVTGKAGPYSIGVLDVFTDEKDYVDDDDVSQHIPRTNFSALRVKRDVFSRSNVGVIAMDKWTEVDTTYSRAVGIDANLSLMENLDLRGLVAGTESDENGRDLAWYVGGGWGNDLFRGEASYLDIGENFDAKMGYIQREDIRSINAEFRYMPRPGIPGIRQMFIGPAVNHLTNHDGVLETREIGFSLWSRLEIGGWLGCEGTHQYDWLDEDFEIREGVFIPSGIYEFNALRSRLFMEGGRMLSASGGLSLGRFYEGKRTGVSGELDVKPTPHLTLEANYDFNKVTLWNARVEEEGRDPAFPPRYAFSTNVMSGRISYSFTTDLFAKLFAQWNDEGEIVSTNFLLHYIYRPGSDFYLVYTESWDTSEGKVRTDSRTILAKVTYLWNL